VCVCVCVCVCLHIYIYIYIYITPAIFSPGRRPHGFADPALVELARGAEPGGNGTGTHVPSSADGGGACGGGHGAVLLMYLYRHIDTSIRHGAVYRYIDIYLYLDMYI